MMIMFIWVLNRLMCEYVLNSGSSIICSGNIVLLKIIMNYRNLCLRCSVMIVKLVVVLMSIVMVGEMIE